MDVRVICGIDIPHERLADYPVFDCKGQLNWSWWYVDLNEVVSVGVQLLGMGTEAIAHEHQVVVVKRAQRLGSCLLPIVALGFLEVREHILAADLEHLAAWDSRLSHKPHRKQRERCWRPNSSNVPLLPLAMPSLYA
mgnify:FL=1